MREGGNVVRGLKVHGENGVEEQPATAWSTLDTMAAILVSQLACCSGQFRIGLPDMINATLLIWAQTAATPQTIVTMLGKCLLNRIRNKITSRRDSLSPPWLFKMIEISGKSSLDRRAQVYS